LIDKKFWWDMRTSEGPIMEQLHGSKYESEIEVRADGLRMTLENPYTVCRLLVRRPNCGESNGDLVEVFEFKDDELDHSSIIR
jgi:hypothetical protein